MAVWSPKQDEGGASIDEWIAEIPDAAAFEAWTESCMMPHVNPRGVRVLNTFFKLINKCEYTTVTVGSSSPIRSLTGEFNSPPKFIYLFKFIYSRDLLYTSTTTVTMGSGARSTTFLSPCCLHFCLAWVLPPRHATLVQVIFI